MISSALGLRLVLGFLAAYHLTIGLLSAFAPAWTRKVTRGLYAVELGALLVVAAIDPLANKPIIVAVIFLQSMRALFRLLHRAELRERFSVPRARNAFNAGLLILQVALLLVWFPT